MKVTHPEMNPCTHSSSSVKVYNVILYLSHGSKLLMNN